MAGPLVASVGSELALGPGVASSDLSSSPPPPHAERAAQATRVSRTSYGGCARRKDHETVVAAASEALPECCHDDRGPGDGRAVADSVASACRSSRPISVVALRMRFAWTFFSMRSVMNVGGSCADGGPYVSSQPCPDGSFLIAIAIPVMLITAMAGSAAALSINAPNLLVPMRGACCSARSGGTSSSSPSAATT